MNLRAMKQFGDMDSFFLYQYRPKCQVLNPGQLFERAYTYAAQLYTIRSETKKRERERERNIC